MSDINVPEEYSQLQAAVQRSDLDPRLRVVIEAVLGTRAVGWAAGYIQGGMIHKTFRMLQGEIPVGDVRPVHPLR